MMEKHLFSHIFGVECAHEAKIGRKISFCVLVHHVKSEYDISRYKITRKQKPRHPARFCPLEVCPLSFGVSVAWYQGKINDL